MFKQFSKKFQEKFMSVRAMFDNFHSLFESEFSFAENQKSVKQFFKKSLFSLKFVFYNNSIIL